MTFEEKLIEIDRIYTTLKETIQGPAEFKAIIEGFSFGVDEMREHLPDPGNLPYGRNCVFRSANFEVIVMNWKPFQRSNIHNHGHSFGCVFAVSGKAVNLLYDDGLELIASIPLVEKKIAGVPYGIYHVIMNDTPDFAVSLHFYAPPMDAMKVIDASDMSKSFFVKGDGGAWNPETVQRVAD